jgi:acetyl-CoA carboxylase, biotin carboxylase subunit
MIKEIKNILIANRGEIAVRIIRSAKELGIRTCAIYSEVDRKMPHVRFADQAYCIGKATPAETYLRKDRIIEIAKKFKVDAIHPGYGFLSENAEFAQMVIDADIIFIGPPPSAIKSMGDKTEARRLVKNAGVLIVPGTERPITNAAEAIEFARRFGFPILLKAVGGGGGKGMRVVNEENEVASAFRSAQSEAYSAFADNRIYVEKYLENPRHIEFQILADEHGNAIHLGERECSIQRRHQKIIEESPSVIISPEMRFSMGEAAVKAALSADYVNAGTIEFLVDKKMNYYFLEMNTRLQVEHAVTEMVSGIDIVKEQIWIAEGKSLKFKQKEIQFRGHAIECRIYAEDPENDFLPSIGEISKLQQPQGFGVREDRGVDQGNEISIFYDPMISKLIVWGGTREESIKKMTRALREYRIIGVKTNIKACEWIINHPRFIKGDFDTHFISDTFKIQSENSNRDNAIRAMAATVVFLRKYKSVENINIEVNADSKSFVSNWGRKRYEYFRGGDD